MKKLLCIPTLLVLTLFAGATGAEDEPRGELIDRIVAVVNDSVILESELDAEVRQLQQALRARDTRLPPEDQFRRQVLDRMIAVELQLQHAKGESIQVSDDRLNQALGEIAQRNNVSLSKLPEFLAQEGLHYNAFREQLREELTLGEVRRQVVENRVSVSPREIDEYLERQQRQGEGEEHLVSHILVTVPGDAPPEAVEQARQHIEMIREKIVNGEASFAEMAVTYSQGQQAFEGGSLGWRRLPELPTLFADSVATMDVGEVSAPIRSGSGWHLVKVDDRQGRERVVATETRARHILLKPNKLRDEAATVAFARRLKKRVESGEDFAALAKEHSEDPGSAVQGGDLGWTPPGVFAPRFQEALDELQPDQVSEPFETQFGIHIAQVLDRRETDFTDTVARNRAYQAIKRRKSEEQFPIWLQKQHDNAHIEIRLED